MRLSIYPIAFIIILVVVLPVIIALQVQLGTLLKEGWRVLPPMEFRGRRGIGSCEVIYLLRVTS
jgi:hypothetical protein